MSVDQCKRVFLPRAFFWIAGLTVSALTISAAPDKWRAHERWRELHAPPPPVERWFMPGESGHEPGVTPPELTGRAFLTRALGGTDRANDGTWSRENRLTPRLAFSHNLSRVFPPSLHAEHPEYFPWEAGRRIRPPEGVQWWNPDLGRADVAAHAAEAAKDHFRQHPEAVSFALGVNDALIFGDSPETRALTVPPAWFRGRPDYSNLVFTFMNRVAALTAREYPDKYVGALAYYWCEDAPEFPVDPHVIPFLTADRAQGYDPVFRAGDRALQRRWVEALRQGAMLKAEAGNLKAETGNLRNEHWISERSVLSTQASDREHDSGLTSQLSALRNDSGFRSQASGLKLRLGIYDYIYGHGFLIPRQHPHLLAEHLRYTRRLGFTDYFAEMTPNWGLDGPQPWLVAQLLQNPEQSADRLLDEYYRRFFKEAAGPMRRFYRRCEKIWLNQPGPSYWLKFFRNEAQASLFPPEVCRELRGYLDAAAAAARHPLVRTRVRQVDEAFGVTERFVAMQTIRDRLNRATLQGRAAPAVLWRDLDGFQKARAEFVRYTEALQANQPLLIAPFKLDDYVKHDPMVNTLMRLARAGLVPAEAAEDRFLTAWREGGPGRRAIRNGAMTGPLKSPRRLAELPYEVALPEEWLSQVEPAEHFQAEWSGAPERVLRLGGNRNTSIFQWNALDGAKVAVAGIKVRGHLTPGASAILAVGWMDARQHNLGAIRQALPTGDWLDWVELFQGGFAPEGAVWVGLSLTIGNQEEGDWLEVKEFSLELK